MASKQAQQWSRSGTSLDVIYNYCRHFDTMITRKGTKFRKQCTMLVVLDSNYCSDHQPEPVQLELALEV